jgi:superoxide reductase
LYVEVGKKPHPQSEDHQITCIVLVTKQTVRRSDIKSNRSAATVFTDKDHGDVYAYCNVHGLYKVSF